MDVSFAFLSGCSCKTMSSTKVGPRHIGVPRSVFLGHVVNLNVEFQISRYTYCFGNQIVKGNRL